MNLKTFLALSLAANLALGYVALRNFTVAKSKGEFVESAAVASKAANSGEAKVAPATATQTAAVGSQGATNVAGKRFDWLSVESADYKEYIANLRAIGCPEETIKDIILADVNKMFDDKKRQAKGPAKKFEYWKAGNPMAAMLGSPEDLKASRQIEEERDATLKNLGIKADFRTQVSGMMNPLDSMFDFVSEDKRAELLKAMSSMQESMAGSGTPDAQDMLKAQREMEKKVKALLTPEEALQYDLRLSMTANMMRQQLGGFDPNEQEFLKVFELRKEFDEQFSPFAMGDEKEADRKRRTEAEKELNEKIKGTLGETRYADYERSKDYQFQQMLKAAQRGEGGTPQAIEGWEMKLAAEQKASELRAQKEMSQQERDAALRAIRMETENSLKQTLGEKAWENYNRPANVSWLDRISRDRTAK